MFIWCWFSLSRYWRLQHIATHCHTLQYCNILQRIASRCILILIHPRWRTSESPCESIYICERMKLSPCKSIQLSQSYVFAFTLAPTMSFSSMSFFKLIVTVELGRGRIGRGRRQERSRERDGCMRARGSCQCRYHWKIRQAVICYTWTHHTFGSLLAAALAAKISLCVYTYGIYIYTSK